MSPGKGRCYIFVDEILNAQHANSLESADLGPDQDPALVNKESLRRRRSFVAALIKRSRLRDAVEVVEVSVAEQQQIHPVEIPDADLIVISWDTANGDGGRGSDQTLQFFATEGRSRLSEVLNPYSDNGAVLFCECQTVQGLPVQAAYDAIFGAGEITVLSETFKAEVRFGSQAYPAKFRGRTHPMMRGFEWPMREAFLANVPGGTQLQLFGPDTYPTPDDSNPVDISPLIHYRRESLWFGWVGQWKRGWVPILIADFSCRTEVEYRGLPEVPAILLAKKTGRGYALASTLWLAGMPEVGRFLRRLQDPDWEAIRSYHRRVRLSQFVTDSIVSITMLAIAVSLSVFVVKATFSSPESALKDLVIGSGITVISIFNIWVVRGWHRVWTRPYGISVLRWLLLPVRKYIQRHKLSHM